MDGITWKRSDGHESEQTLGDSEGQGSLACSSPWGHKESDTAEQLNNKILNFCRQRSVNISKEEKKINSSLNMLFINMEVNIRGNN